MKKILTTLAMASTFASTMNADMIRTEIGGGLWGQNPSGTFKYEDGAIRGKYTSNEEFNNGAYVWMFIKHPLPAVPNLRLEFTDMKDEAIVNGKFDDFEATNSPARIKLKEYDVIPYYNILDNTFWATLDLGLDIKVIDSTFEVDEADVNGEIVKYTDTAMIPLPMLYARVRTEIPLSGFAFETDGKYFAYNGSVVYDVRAKVDYTFDSFPLVQPAIEVGYRIQKFDISIDGDKKKLDIDFSGVYAGLMLRF